MLAKETFSGIRRYVCMLLAVSAMASCSLDEGMPLRVGTNQWPGYEPLYLAQNLNYFHRWDIRLVQLPSTTDVMHALKNRRLEAAALTLDEALNVIAQGMELKIILVMDVSNGADVLLASKDIASLADLRGRRVGVENTAVGAVLLDAALDTAGLAVSDIELVQLTVDRHAQAFLSGSVDAVVTFDPVRTQLLRSGAKVLFDSSRIPGRIVDVLAVRSDVVAEQGVHLRMLLEGYFRARGYMRDNMRHAAELMAPRLQESPEGLMAAYEGLELPTLAENRALLRQGGGLEDSIIQLHGLMVREKLIPDGAVPASTGSDLFLPPGS